MDDRPDMQEYLDSLAPEQRAELEAFLRRFNEQVDARTAVLLYELQDPTYLSIEAREMRARLLDGYVPLIDDDGQLIFRKREELTLEDARRFGAFMDRDAERRKRQIGDLSDSSEN